MTFRLIVKPKAQEDIQLGRDFYNAIRPQLANDYLSEFDKCIELILAHQQAWHTNGATLILSCQFTSNSAIRFEEVNRQSVSHC